MKKVTIQDFRIAMRKVANNSEQMSVILRNLSDEELFKSNIEQDLHLYSGRVGHVIKQISIDKQINLPQELHKVLPDCIVGTLLDTVNLCLREEEQMGINVDLKG